MNQREYEDWKTFHGRCGLVAYFLAPLLMLALLLAAVLWGGR